MAEESHRLKIMGWTFVCLGVIVSATVYFLPNDETTYWLSMNGKEGFYVLSAFFAFLGLYCLGAVWRKRNFL